MSEGRMTMTETTNNTEDRTTTSIVIRTEQRDRLRALAREQKTDVSTLLRDIIDRGLTSYETTVKAKRERERTEKRDALAKQIADLQRRMVELESEGATSPQQSLLPLTEPRAKAIHKRTPNVATKVAEILCSTWNSTEMDLCFAIYGERTDEARRRLVRTLARFEGRGFASVNLTAKGSRCWNITHKGREWWAGVVEGREQFLDALRNEGK